jgi:Tfp pilus assembly protein PilF
LWWKCTRDPAFNFLPTDHRSEWIFFPSALAGEMHPVAAIDTTFRRSFEIPAAPKSAQLFLRGAKRVELRINGKPVETGAVGNWKVVSAADVLAFLNAGENKIEARVFNNDAPPALWFLLTTDQVTLTSDQTWEASLVGSAWRSAALASISRRPGAGNFLGGGETTVGVLPKIWWLWAVLGVVALLLSMMLRRWSATGIDFSSKQILLLLGVIVLAWVILFWNNTRLLPFHTGYDSKAHLAYIDYIQQQRALPSPNEGFEMFQPPLYYLLSAAALSVGHLSIADPSSVAVLRTLTMIFGMANFIFVFLSLRLLFPLQRDSQFSGLLLAAFLPMQLYLSHYVTNETLNAALVSASIYFALRILQTEKVLLGEAGLLGLFVGAAILTKTTSLLLIPPLVGALGIKLQRQRAPISFWLRALGLPLVVAFIVCGWQFIRIWARTGTPIVSNFGNWDPAFGFNFWQDPGFHVIADYFRFGRSLLAPLYSGFNGFADGIYSTLWGDGLCGGFRLPLRPPWNYELVVGGYLIALVPTILALIGVAGAINRLIRQSSPEWFFLLGYSAVLAIALVFISLRVPSYSVVKAFYALSALVPFSAFVASGFKTWAAFRPRIRLFLMAFLIFWALNSFASVWIYPSASQHIHVSMRSVLENQRDRAIAEASEAIKSNPSSSTARCLLASSLDDAGEQEKALEEVQHAIQSDPTNGDCHLLFGVMLGKQKEMDKAVEEARRALQLAPENSSTYDLLFTCLRETGHFDQAMTVERDALAISPFDAGLHYRAGLGAGEIGDFVYAVPQFAYTLLLEPNHPDAAKKLDLAMRFTAKIPMLKNNWPRLCGRLRIFRRY